MNCQEYRQQRLLDQEAGVVSAEARLHAAACNQCRSLDEEENRLHTELRNLAESEEAPPTLRQWIQEKYPERFRSHWAMRRWVAAAAAILVVAGAATGVLWRHHAQTPAPERLAQAFVADYLEFLPGREEISANSPDAAREWLQGHVDFPVRVPEVPGAKIESARICSISGRKAALLQYRHEASNSLISVFETEEPKAYERKKMPIRVETSGHGVHSTLWCHHGLVYDVVASLDEPSLREITEAVQRQTQ